MKHVVREHVDGDGWSAAVLDAPPYPESAFYRQIAPGNLKAPTIAIVAADAERVRKLLEDNPYGLSGLIAECSAARWPSFGDAARRLRGHMVLYDRHDRVDDDSRVRAAFPPPEGIDVSYRWSGAEEQLRLDARTEKRGTVVTRTVLVHPMDKDLPGQIAAAYARFVRTSPAPKTASGLRCGAHVAELLEGVDRAGAVGLAGWRAKVEAAPLHARAEVGSHHLPGRSLGKGREFTGLTLRGVNGADEIAANLAYRGGHAVEPSVLRVRSAIPEALKAGACGKGADAIWGAAELRHVTLGRHKQEVVTRNADKNGEMVEQLENLFHMEYDRVAMPAPRGRETDSEDARDRLERNFSDVTCSSALLPILRDADPRDLLHVMRLAKAQPNQEIEVASWLGQGVRTITLTNPWRQGGRPHLTITLMDDVDASAAWRTR